MTLEHKILTLIDRGVHDAYTVRGIVGRSAVARMRAMRRLGLVTQVEWQSGNTVQRSRLALTPAGLELLDSLDETVAF